MTYEEAIEWFESVTPYYDDEEEAITIAIECIKKQIPKKPIPYRIKSNPNCSKCGRVISAVEYARKIDYCCDCGQAIDWSDEK